MKDLLSTTRLSKGLHYGYKVPEPSRLIKTDCGTYKIENSMLYKDKYEQVIDYKASTVVLDSWPAVITEMGM